MKHHPSRTLALCSALGLALPFTPLAVANDTAGTARAFDPSQRLLIDTDSETGAVWVRGANYKLALDQEGARFFVPPPDGGPAAVLRMAPPEVRAGGIAVPVLSAAQAERSGNGAHYDRGSLWEVWQFQPSGVRQNFVLLAPPPPGDLVIRMNLGGELLPEPGAGELAFASASGARASYGDWFAFDQRGATAKGRPRHANGAIELHIDGAYLSSAVYPLVIDPVLTSTTLLSTTHSVNSHDIATDDSLGVLMSVHEDTFAAGDEDVIARRYTQAGVFLSESPVEISNESSMNPAVANHEVANQFLVVWEDFPDQPYEIARIRARTHNAGSTSMGSAFTVNLGDAAGFPDVGGPSSNSALAPYYVVWSEYSFVPPFDGDVAGRTVTPSGTTGNKVKLDSRNSHQSPPRISNRSGPGGRWMVVYKTDIANGVTSIDSAMIHDTGGVLSSMTSLAQGVYNLPNVDGDGVEFLTVFDGSDGNGVRNIFGVQTTFGSPSIHVPLALSSAELSFKLLGRDQRTPSVVRHKNHYTYTYVEAPPSSTSSGSIYAATIQAQVSPLVFTERHVLLSEDPGCFNPVMCNGLLEKEAFVAWLEPGTVDLLQYAVFEPQ